MITRGLKEQTFSATTTNWSVHEDKDKKISEPTNGCMYMI